MARSSRAMTPWECGAQACWVSVADRELDRLVHDHGKREQHHVDIEQRTGEHRSRAPDVSRDGAVPGAACLVAAVNALLRISQPGRAGQTHEINRLQAALKRGAGI